MSGARSSLPCSSAHSVCTATQQGYGSPKCQERATTSPVAHAGNHPDRTASVARRGTRQRSLVPCSRTRPRHGLTQVAPRSQPSPSNAPLHARLEGWLAATPRATSGSSRNSLARALCLGRHALQIKATLRQEHPWPAQSAAVQPARSSSCASPCMRSSAALMVNQHCG